MFKKDEKNNRSLAETMIKARLPNVQPHLINNEATIG